MKRKTIRIVMVASFLCLAIMPNIGVMAYEPIAPLNEVPVGDASTCVTTTGGGCFRSGFTTRVGSGGISNQILWATHGNPTHSHNVTASSLVAGPLTSAWRAPQRTGYARAEVIASGVLNRTFWNIR